MKNRRYSKMVLILSLVVTIATLLWFAPPATLCYAQGYGGGGGIAVPTYPGFTSLINKIDIAGVITEDVTAKSIDNICQLTIKKGTKALDKIGNPLSGIVMVDMEKPPAPPANVSAVGKTYDLGPEDATFVLSITISFTYDPDDVPKGVDEKKLVIATWDEDADKWVELKDCTVKPETHTISAPISHFTAFTILAHTRPAAFTVSALSISPTAVDSGESISISVDVTNTGDLPGSNTVTIKIDNVTVATQVVALAGGASQTVTFTTTEDAAGTYTVNVNGLSDTFIVRGAVEEVPAKPAAFTTGTLNISPKEVDIGQTVTISVMVTNTGDLTGSYTVTLKIDNVTIATEDVALAGGASQTVTFTTTEDTAGTYTVNVNGLGGTFIVKAAPVAPTPAARVSWWVWVIVAAMIVIGGVLAYFFWWRQREAGEEETSE